MKQLSLPVFALICLTLLISASGVFHAPVEDVPAYSWLEGSWIGDGFGGTSEEVWSAPSADGTMMGTYRHHSGDGNLTFYEFLVLDSVGMHVKHFHPNLEAWEEKADHLTFEMIRATDREIEMKGLRIEYLPPDSMRLYLSMRRNDGSQYTEIFRMKRK